MIAKAAGLGTVFSAHDFFLACARYHLLNYEQRFCDIANRTITACDVCLKTAEALPAGVQQTRRAFIAEMLQSIDVLLFGSAYSERLISTIYPVLAEKTRAVLGIPTPFDALGGRPPRPPKRDGDKLVVALLGNFTRAKGADAAISIMENANPELFEFHVRGKAEAQFAEVLQRINKPNVTYHGRYTPGDLDALARADVSLHLSIWPETFCIALSEAWQAGLVPIVSDIGALGDRVTDGVDGFKVPIGDVSAVLNRLELLRASPALLETMRTAIGPHLWVDQRRYADALLDLYRSVSPRTVVGIGNLHLDVGQLHLVPHASWKHLAPPRHIFDPPRASATRLELPSGIRQWISIQGSQFHIERVCDTMIAELADGTFKPADEFAMEGWTFIPDVGVAGQVWVVLVEEKGSPVIFLPTERIGRDDVARAAPGAPSRSGFLTRAALRGRWSDGLHRVALVKSVGDRAGFQLTYLRIRLFEGRVTEAEVAAPDNDDVLRAFAHVAAQAPLGDGDAQRPASSAAAKQLLDGGAAPKRRTAAPSNGAGATDGASTPDAETPPPKSRRAPAGQERNGRRKASGVA